MRAALAAVVLLLAGCVAGTPPDGTVLEVQPQLPEGYPPKIGAVVADLGGVTRAWDMFDYSIGAFDASVQVMSFNEKTLFRLMGEPPGQPDAEKDRLVIGATMTGITQTGALTDPLIEIIAGKNFVGRRMTSSGSDTVLVLDSLSPMTAGSYGKVTGHFSTTLCAADGKPVRVDRSKCQPFSGTFTSDLQISGP